MAARLFPIPIRATLVGGESIWTVVLCDNVSDLPSTANPGDLAIMLDTGNSRRFVSGEWAAPTPATNSVDTAAIQDGAVTLAKTSGLGTLATQSGTFTAIPQANVTNLTTDLAAKQPTLVSATNIKTVNGSSLLGSGDLPISGSGLTQPQVLARGLGA